MEHHGSPRKQTMASAARKGEEHEQSSLCDTVGLPDFGGGDVVHDSALVAVLVSQIFFGGGADRKRRGRKMSFTRNTLS